MPYNYKKVMREYAKCQEMINSSMNFDDGTLPQISISLQEMEINSRSLISYMEYNPTCIEYEKRELQAIYHLIESHAVLLRLQAQHRYNKTAERQDLLGIPQIFGLNPAYTRFNVENKAEDFALALKTRLAEFPEEWYMVQLTAHYEPSETSIYNTSEISNMIPIHISVLPTGNNAIPPFCITVPKPKSNTNYDVCREIHDILSTNKLNLEASYANNKLYWKMRERQNNKMKTAVDALESIWLREWRILFIADPIEELDLVKDISDMINKLIADNKSSNHITEQTRWLLHKIALGACFLTRAEIASAIKYVLSFDEKLCDNVIFSIYGKMSTLTPLRTAKRKTLVLIVDESLDHIPFEVMVVLQNHPVTRFPSLHMAYALYKEHEETIENGCKVIETGKDNGSFIVNPSGNLPELEKRMKLFIDYWLPHWTGSYNIQPDAESFESALTNYDILMYSGHGSGIQYLSAERIERLRVKAIVLIFGCGSAKLWAVGGRFPPIGVFNQYLIACSPCTLGMLWEVTDCDVDKLTANFISNWIPSPAPRPWSDVKINEWITGVLEFKNLEDISTDTKACKTSAKLNMPHASAKSKSQNFNFEHGISARSMSDTKSCKTSAELKLPRASTKFKIKNFNLEDGISALSISHTKSCETSVEPEMLRALAKARGTCSQYMTMAAVVVRGLPIKLKRL